VGEGGGGQAAATDRLKEHADRGLVAHSEPGDAVVNYLFAGI
jgi:hypothetical protein